MTPISISETVHWRRRHHCGLVTKKIKLLSISGRWFCIWKILEINAAAALWIMHQLICLAESRWEPFDIWPKARNWNVWRGSAKVAKWQSGRAAPGDRSPHHQHLWWICGVSKAAKLPKGPLEFPAGGFLFLKNKKYLSRSSKGLLAFIIMIFMDYFEALNTWQNRVPALKPLPI